MVIVLTLARNINRLAITVARARNADGAGDGVIFATGGDGFAAAFARASGAVAASQFRNSK